MPVVHDARSWCAAGWRGARRGHGAPGL